MKKILFLLSVSFALPSMAWIPPPNDFFQQWITENKNATSILIKQDHEFLKDGVTTQMISETVKIKRPGLYKRTSNMNGQEEIRVLGKTKAMVGAPKALRQVQMKDVISPLDVPLIYGQAGTVESVFKQIGVDTSKYALELIDHEPLTRVGDREGNHFYISSLSNQINQMVYGGMIYRFKYDSKVSSRYPSDIEVYDGEELKEKIHVKSVSTSAKISEQDFESL